LDCAGPGAASDAAPAWFGAGCDGVDCGDALGDDASGGFCSGELVVELCAAAGTLIASNSAIDKNPVVR